MHPLRPQSFAIAITRAAVAAAPRWGLGAAARLTIDSRVDVDSQDRFPQVIVQTSGSQPLDMGPHGDAALIRVVWRISDLDVDVAEQAAVDLEDALVRCWRAATVTDEGWMSHLDITQDPVLTNITTVTDDSQEFTMIAEIVARTGRTI